MLRLGVNIDHVATVRNARGTPWPDPLRAALLAQEAGADGKFDINWVAERHMPPTYQWRREDYNRKAKLDEFLPWFENWNFDWLDVPGLIRNCPHAYEYPLVDRDPIPQWTFGRVTLMGDAAHPMLQYFAQGACQAMEDAVCLSHMLANHDDQAAALDAVGDADFQKIAHKRILELMERAHEEPGAPEDQQQQQQRRHHPALDHPLAQHLHRT